MSLQTDIPADVLELAGAWASIGGHDDSPGAAAVSRTVTEDFLAHSEPEELRSRMRLLVQLAEALLDLDRYDGVEIAESLVGWEPNTASTRATPPSPDERDILHPVMLARILLAKHHADRAISGETYFMSEALGQLEAVDLDLSRAHGTAARLASAEVSYIRACTLAVLGDARVAIAEFRASAERVANIDSAAAAELRVRASVPAELLGNILVPLDAAPPREMQRDLDRMRWRARLSGLLYTTAYNAANAALGAAITAGDRRWRVGLLTGAVGTRVAARQLQRPAREYDAIRTHQENELELSSSAAARDHLRARRIVVDSITRGQPFVLLLRNFELTRVTRRSRYEDPLALGRYLNALQRRRLLPRLRTGASMFANANMRSIEPSEADLVRALTRYAPVVQVANVGDYSRDIGPMDWIAGPSVSSAASLHLGDQGWEEVVRGLVRAAQFIVIWLGMGSAGVDREFDIIRAAAREPATVVVRAGPSALEDAQRAREVLGGLADVEPGDARPALDPAETSGFRQVDSGAVAYSRLDEDPTFGDLVRKATTRASMPLLDRLRDQARDMECSLSQDRSTPARRV